jgi:hypothetical protein
VEVRHGHKACDKDTVIMGHTMKCPRDNCQYDTATQPAGNRSQQMKLELLRAHAVVVHVVGTDNLVFACLLACNVGKSVIHCQRGWRQCYGDAASMTSPVVEHW